jgi:hypothetical protein
LEVGDVGAEVEHALALRTSPTLRFASGCGVSGREAWHRWGGGSWGMGGVRNPECEIDDEI